MAARSFSIEYKGRLVQSRIRELEYEMKDVVNSICCLSERDFNKTHSYENQEQPYDEYIFYYKKPQKEDEDDYDYAEREPDKLYVKFCLINGTLILELASFHLAQY